MQGLRIRAPQGAQRSSRAAAAAAAPPPPIRAARRRQRRCGVVAASTTAQQQQKHVAIVGAGVGGLCVAGILARQGHRVTVFEQNERVGGRCQGEVFEAPTTSGRRFRFDTGPSLLLLPDAYRAAFERMGQPSLEAAGLKLRRVGPEVAYRVFFTDDDEGDDDRSQEQPTRSLDLLYDPDAMVAQLDARGGSIPSAAQSYRAWLKDAVRMLDSGFGAFIARDFGPASDGPFKALLRVLDPRVLIPLLTEGRLPSNVFEMLEPHARALARRFPDDPDLQALLSFQDLYVGLSPQSAPGVFSLLAATELRDGVFYAEGGFGAVRDALLRAALAAGSVEVRTGTRVRRVVVVDSAGGGGGGGASSVVTGVEVEDETGSEFIPADAVVCNADVPSAYALLGKVDRGQASRHGAEVSSRLLKTKEYSAGVIAYYWCVEGGALTQLPQHTVFVRSPHGGRGGAGAERAWRHARSARELETAPNFYVHCPCRTDPTAVSHPGEADSIMVLLPVANLQEVARAGGGAAAFDGALVAAGRAAILRALAAACPGTLAEAGGASDLADRIVREEVRAPPQWRERHALAHGAAFGLSHGLDQLAALRPALKDGNVAGLYCVGASARPGNGVPLVLTGAGLCADAVLEDLAAAGG
jgi:phytoene desaturase (3,4-didehydrolycopene-forming)